MSRLCSALICLFLFLNCLSVYSQDDSKVILITLDGLRWQELFSGADSLLIANTKYVEDAAGLKKDFWRESAFERREALLPFLWKEVSKMGQLHGNRDLGSKVDLTNKKWFSYPGYNEILSGKADDERINSNDKVLNPNKTILEIANNDPRYKGKVAAFGSWDAFPYIINEKRSGVPVNAGFELATGNDLSEREKFLNELQPNMPSQWETVRSDAFTHHYALEHMKKTHPKLVYIAYGETDDFTDVGDYKAYLKSWNTTDSFLKNLWTFTQNDPFYKDQTQFIITTDHGRWAIELNTWTGHGGKIKDAGSVWLIRFGKGVSAGGEVNKSEQLFSNQIAPTILKLLKLSPAINSMEGKPFPNDN